MQPCPAPRARASHLFTTSGPRAPGPSQPPLWVTLQHLTLPLSRHNTAQDSQPEGPLGTRSHHPQKSLPALPRGTDLLSTRASSPAAQRKAGDSSRAAAPGGQQGGALPVLLPTHTAMHLHQTKVAPGLEYGWRNPSLQELGLPRDGAGSVQDRLSAPWQRHRSPGNQAG